MNSIKLDIIHAQVKQGFEVDDAQLAVATKNIFKPMSFQDTFHNRYEGFKGVALRIVEWVVFCGTFGGVGFWAIAKMSEVSDKNKAKREYLQSLNFTVFVDHVFDFEILNVSPDQAAKGNIKLFPINKKNQVLHYRLETLPEIANVIEKILKTYPKYQRTDETRRAIQTALTIQAILTPVMTMENRNIKRTLEGEFARRAWIIDAMKQV